MEFNMRLEAFRVQNYKKVRDTGWVTCGNLTAFVGKNEAGKSAIFRGLSNLNHSDDEHYDGLKEFPRRRYTTEFNSQDWPVSTGRFSLDEAEQKTLASICPILDSVESVEVTRHYSWDSTVEFIPPPQEDSVTTKELQEAVRNTIRAIQKLTAPEGKGEILGPMKETIVSALENMMGDGAGTDLATRPQIEQAINTITAQANEGWQQKLLSPLLPTFQELVERAEFDEKIQAAKNWVTENLPRFIYFDRIDVIDSAVHIPTFAVKVSQDGGAPRIRATNCLFKQVGLDVNELAKLGLAMVQGEEAVDEVRRYVDERAILLSSASNAMTQKFEDWWEQRRHKFRYQIDGDYFRVWVSDDLDPSEIELDQRSMGMQYFFSFYVVFIVEAEGAHVNSILLLDDPGLHLHGTAQAKIVEFLEKLSKENQLLYTTHSPFMIDVDHLERTRAVYEDADGTTKVSEDVWPRDKDSLFPLQAALGYKLAQGLFISKRQLVVEGIIDLSLLKSLDLALAATGRTTLREDIVILPAGGVSNLLPLASMLIGHDVQVAVLLDGDEPGRRGGQRLDDKLLAGKDRKSLFIGDFVDNSNAELEDIFPEEEYLSAVKEAYPGVVLRFSKSDEAMPGVVRKVQALFERRKEGPFEKWKPAMILRDRILKSPRNVNSSTLDVMENIFVSINSLF